MQSYKELFLSILCIISVLLNIVLGIKLNNTHIEVETQTVYVNDTIVRDSIQILERTKCIYTTVFDTIIVVDSIKVPIELPIEHKIYAETINKDSISYNLQINYSGFHSSIDKIDLTSSFIKEEVKITKDNPWRWCIAIGPYVGYGASITPSTGLVRLSPEIGIGIQVGFGYTFKHKKI